MRVICLCAGRLSQGPLLGNLHWLTTRAPIFSAGSLVPHVQITFANRHTPLTPMPRLRLLQAATLSTLHMDRATPTERLEQIPSPWAASPSLIRRLVCLFFPPTAMRASALADCECIGVVTTTSADLISYPLSGLMGLAWQSIASSGATPFWQTLAASGKWDAPEMGVYLKRYRGDNTASQVETDGGEILFG